MSITISPLTPAPLSLKGEGRKPPIELDGFRHMQYVQSCGIASGFPFDSRSHRRRWNTGLHQWIGQLSNGT